MSASDIPPIQASHVLLAAGGSGIVASSLNGILLICGVPTNISGVISAAVFCDKDSQEVLVGAILLSKAVVVLRVNPGSKELSWTQIAKHALPKRLSSLCFAQSPRCVVVADTTGDMYRLPLEGECDLKTEAVQESHLLLGHFSLLTDVSIGYRCVATSDRDNRIRISRFPDSFVIENFLLGHSDFVTCVRWISEKKLLSGAGDGTLRVWNVDSGESTVFHFCDDEKKPASIISSIDIAPSNEHLAAILVHGKPALYIFSIDESALSISCEFLGEDHATSFSGACFDGNGILWVSRISTAALIGYKLIRAEDGSMELKQHSTCNVVEVAAPKTDSTQCGEMGLANVSFVRSEWLSQLRKKPIVENWKGKKRKSADP